ncbi:MAG: DapH/DapD/GlmU-related protein [Planctomycetota bacterium]
MDIFIHRTAKVGKDSTIGQYAVIEGDVHIGRNCDIGHHVVIKSGTVIGDNVRIDEHTVIGKQPMKAKRSATTKTQVFPPARIGNNVLIGASVIIYCGCKIGSDILIADFASIRENVVVGDETIIGRGVAIENKCSVGKRCKVETEVYICAYSTISDDCFIAPEVTFTNDNFLARTKERFKYFKGPTLKRGARIGANATILPGRMLGADCLVAAGAIVTKDVPARTVVMGAPARQIRPVPKEQLLENQ